MQSCFVYVPANEIWSTATSYVDEGIRTGLVRGYNVEVAKSDGTTDWMSATYIRGTIEEYLEEEFTKWWYSDLGVTPTGRICFRGYGIEEYDDYERETFILTCDPEGNIIEEKQCVNV